MLVIHAGPHKTATSYLQKHFWRDRAELAAQGWHYPDLPELSTATAHHDIAHACESYFGQDPVRTDALQRLGREQTDNILLSSEGFRVWQTGQLEALMRHLNRDRVDIVYAVRDPMHLFYSYWAEEVKQGFTASLAERFTNHFNDPYRSAILNPLIDLHRFRQLPAVRLRVVPFDVLNARGIDIYDHICRAVLGIEPPQAADRSPVNSSFPIELTEFLRLVSRLEAGSNRILGEEFRIRFMRAHSRDELDQMADLIRREGGPARRVILIPEDHALKTGFDKALKLALKDSWTVDPGEDPLFPRNVAEMVYYDTFELWQINPIRDHAIAVWKSLTR